MCPGGGETSSSPDKDDAIAGSLLALPKRSDQMVQLLRDANVVHLPILAEYFSVALAFAALGALIRGSKSTTKLSQRVGLQIMLKNALDRLQLLARNAHALEQKLAASEDSLASLLHRRHEDGKANEKVVAIFASYEQSWKSEKRKLQREIEALKNEVVNSRKHRVRSGVGSCEDCKAKVREIENLEESLCEKEFLMAAAMDEARSDQHERNQLAGKLAVTELSLLDTKDELSKESAALQHLNRQHEELSASLESAKREVDALNAEKMNQNALSEELTASLESAKREVDALNAEKMNQNAMIEELLDEVSSSQADARDKEEVIAVLMKRHRQEREELLQQLQHAKAKRKCAETEKDRWKRLAEERARISPVVSKLRRSLGSRVDVDKASEMQRIHSEEVQCLKSRIEDLQVQVKCFEESKRRISEDMRDTDCVKCEELVALLESAAPDVDVMEIQEVPTSAGAVKEWLQRWLNAVKVQQEQRHWRELDAFERQIRLKDERLESFRWQLLSMESEFSKMKSELEMLKSRLAIALDEKCRAEIAVKELMKTPNHEAQHRALTSMQKELNDAKKKLEVIEVEHQKDLLKVMEDYEVELRQKDHHLAVVEAKLCQRRIQIENEKRSSPKKIPDVVLSEEAVSEKVYKIAVVEVQEENVMNAMSLARSEVEKFTDQVADVRKQVMESEENGLEALIHQSPAVSNSGKKLPRLKNAISMEEIDSARVTLFRDEAASQSLPDLPSSNVEEHEIIYHVHCDEASISGAPEEEVSEDSEKSLDNSDPEITSKDSDAALVEINSGLENEQAIDEEVGENWPNSAEKREIRRRTLEELFLDSPSESAVENAFQVQVVNSNAKKGKSRFSTHGVLQAIESNTLVEISPRRKKVVNVANPSQAAASLFSLSKSRRSDVSQTREEIQVLGLALEVRKIEEELLQIDRRCMSPPDVVINPRTGLGITPKSTPPKRFNKRYAALTGKVGQLAKQMGLTSERSPEMVTDNPLFTRRPTTSEILSLQNRAEAVCQSLALIESQDADHYGWSTDEQTGHLIKQERLVDTVKAHLSQVERSLSSRMEPMMFQQQFSPKQRT